jgi:hypothetical protein
MRGEQLPQQNGNSRDEAGAAVNVRGKCGMGRLAGGDIVIRIGMIYLTNPDWECKIEE